MSFNPNKPAAHTPVDADELRGQFNGLKSLIDGGSAPVGCVLAYLKSFPNAPALPPAWAECNGQVLNDVARRVSCVGRARAAARAGVRRTRTGWT